MDQKLNDLKRALQSDPKNRGLRSQLASLCLRSGDPAEAFTLLEERDLSQHDQAVFELAKKQLVATQREALENNPTENIDFAILRKMSRPNDWDWEPSGRALKFTYPIQAIMLTPQWNPSVIQILPSLLVARECNFRRCRNLSFKELANLPTLHRVETLRVLINQDFADFPLSQILPGLQNLILHTGPFPKPTQNLSRLEMARLAAKESLDQTRSVRRRADNGRGDLPLRERPADAEQRSLTQPDQVEKYVFLDESGLRSIIELPKLTRLELMGVQITDQQVSQLQQSQTLQHLKLLGCLLLSEAILPHLRQIPKIQSVELIGCMNVSEQAFRSFEEDCRRQSLSLSLRYVR